MSHVKSCDSLAHYVAGDCFEWRGLQTIVVPNLSGGCTGCVGENTNCSDLPLCYRTPERQEPISFAPDLEHEPTAQRIALMRLRGEL